MRLYIDTSVINGLLVKDRLRIKKVIPAKYLPDALHIATAVTHNIHVLVSWNFAHMVKHQTRIAVNAINLRLDYPQIDICSPEEV